MSKKTFFGFAWSYTHDIPRYARPVEHVIMTATIVLSSLKRSSISVSITFYIMEYFSLGSIRVKCWGNKFGAYVFWRKVLRILMLTGRKSLLHIVSMACRGNGFYCMAPIDGQYWLLCICCTLHQPLTSCRWCCQVKFVAWGPRTRRAVVYPVRKLFRISIVVASLALLSIC